MTAYFKIVYYGYHMVLKHGHLEQRFLKWRSAIGDCPRSSIHRSGDGP